MYEYKALVVRVIDGDTVVLDVDLGFQIHVQWHIRLAGLNAPEVGTEEGDEAKRFMVLGLPVGMAVTLHTEKDKQEKYGRYLGTIWRDGEWSSVNGQLVENGLAVVWNGKGAKP